MAKLDETLSTERQLEAAVRVHGPATLAQTFSAFVGQFYDRSEFDALARRVDALYGRDSAATADSFRSRLDHRLCDRHHQPVAWETERPTGAWAA